MRTFLAAIAASALIVIPVGAYAQNGQQTTETQQTLKDSVKAKPPTTKRQEIIRSESDKTDTNGATNGASPK
jgi:hypothetical protein